MKRLTLIIFVLLLPIKISYHYCVDMILKEKEYDVVFTLRGTTYQPVTNQCDSDPLVTANMTKIDLKKLKKGTQKLCAFSYDVKHKYKLKFGDKFDLYNDEGKYLGRYTFCDHMNRRIKNTCDILISPDDKPYLCKNLLVKKVNLNKRTKS